MSTIAGWLWIDGRLVTGLRAVSTTGRGVFQPVLKNSHTATGERKHRPLRYDDPPSVVECSSRGAISVAGNGCLWRQQRALNTARSPPDAVGICA